jgi:hypothetical protein
MAGKAVLLGTVIVPLTLAFGITGTAFAVLFSTVLIQVFVQRRALSVIGRPLRDLLRSLAGPAFAGSALGAVVVVVRMFAPFGYRTVFFFVAVGLGLAAYLVILLWIDSRMPYRLKPVYTQFVRGMFSQMRQRRQMPTEG